MKSGGPTVSDEQINTWNGAAQSASKLEDMATKTKQQLEHQRNQIHELQQRLSSIDKTDDIKRIDNTLRDVQN